MASSLGPRPPSFYVIGPSSTGKTTLCEALSKRLGITGDYFVREVAREVMKQKGYSRNTIALMEMQSDIMEAHYIKEDALDQGASQIRVCDRSTIDAIVYAILTSVNTHEAKQRQNILTNNDKFDRSLQRYKAAQSIVILLKPVASWLVDDGIRSTENQVECLTIFRGLLRELGVEYFEIGDEMKFLDERVNFVMGLARL